MNGKERKIRSSTACYAEKDGKIVGEFLSINEASRKLGVNKGNIKYSLDNSFVTKEGYLFMRIEGKKKNIHKIDTLKKRAKRLSCNVDWLTDDERMLYEKAVYSALCWGEKIELKNM